jgi:hypothetical protein
MQSCVDNSSSFSLPKPPYTESSWFALGPIRNTSDAFESCCQSAGEEYSDSGCFRYCNITAPGLTVDTVKSCLDRAARDADIGFFGSLSDNVSHADRIMIVQFADCDKENDTKLC